MSQVAASADDSSYQTRADQIFAAFQAFHRDNPKVWELFQRFTLQAIESGREHYGVSAIFERIRWHVDVETLVDGELKLNNNFRAYYARLFHVAYPQHAAFFRNRERISEHKEAYGQDQQEFIAPPAPPEDHLNKRLAALLGLE